MSPGELFFITTRRICSYCCPLFLSGNSGLNSGTGSGRTLSASSSILWSLLSEKADDFLNASGLCTPTEPANGGKPDKNF